MTKFLNNELAEVLLKVLQQNPDFTKQVIDAVKSAPSQEEKAKEALETIVIQEKDNNPSPVEIDPDTQAALDFCNAFDNKLSTAIHKRHRKVATIISKRSNFNKKQTAEIIQRLDNLLNIETAFSDNTIKTAISADYGHGTYVNITGTINEVDGLKNIKERRRYFQSISMRSVRGKLLGLESKFKPPVVDHIVKELLRQSYLTPEQIADAFNPDGGGGEPVSPTTPTPDDTSTAPVINEELSNPKTEPKKTGTKRSKKPRTRGLRRAQERKDDEFYTRLEDVEKYLEHYSKCFKNKKVYCNCDDPNKSNFVKFFINNFEKLKLKKLIVSHCTKHTGGTPTKFIKTLQNEETTPLNGDGSFDSPECLELLKDADIVVTNPPFSLFRDFIDLLYDYKKDFIVAGFHLAHTYLNILPHVKKGEFHTASIERFNKFIGPDGTERNAPVLFYTNLEQALKIKRPLIPLNKWFDPVIYPQYDNLDAINIDKVVDIPCDYKGVMGVPVTIFPKINPSQFKILDAVSDLTIDGKGKFSRLLIQRATVE